MEKRLNAFKFRQKNFSSLAICSSRLSVANKTPLDMNLNIFKLEILIKKEVKNKFGISFKSIFGIYL